MSAVTGRARAVRGAAVALMLVAVGVFVWRLNRPGASVDGAVLSKADRIAGELDRRQIEAGAVDLTAAPDGQTRPDGPQDVGAP